MDIQISTVLVIQIIAMSLAGIPIIASFFKHRLEAVLLLSVLCLSIVFGGLYFPSLLELTYKAVPNLGWCISKLQAYDELLVSSWQSFSSWFTFVFASTVVWCAFVSLRIIEGRSNVIRGTKLLTFDQMKSEIKKYGWPKLPVNIGQFIVPESLISRSWVLIGEPGTGKTLMILRFIISYFKRGEVFFCVDIGADIFRKMGKEEDILIAPTYENSQIWSPFSEIYSSSDCKALASMMIDKSPGESGSWDEKAIDYTADLLYFCKKEKRATNGDLTYFVRLAPLEELKEIFHGTSTMRLFESGSEKMLSNVQSIVSQNLSFFDVLEPSAGDDSFSFRKWVRERKTNLWLINDESSQEVTLPLRRVGISLIIRESLSLGEDRSRRINVILDELPANGRIATLQNALAQGRKFGLNFLLGFQSLPLLYSVYGRDVAQAILGSAGHCVVLRTPDVESAEYFSGTIGSSVTERESVSVSKPNNSVTKQKVRENQRTVTPEDIQSLKDLNGYIKISSIGWSKIKVPIVNVDNKNHLEPKVINDIEELDSLPAPKNPIKTKSLDDI